MMKKQYTFCEAEWSWPQEFCCPLIRCWFNESWKSRFLPLLKSLLLCSLQLKTYPEEGCWGNWEAELIHKAEAKKGHDSYVKDVKFHSTKLYCASRICQPRYQICTDEISMGALGGARDHCIKSYPRGYMQESVGHREDMFNFTQRDQERLHKRSSVSMNYWRMKRS